MNRPILDASVLRDNPEAIRRCFNESTASALGPRNGKFGHAPHSTDSGISGSSQPWMPIRIGLKKVYSNPKAAARIPAELDPLSVFEKDDLIRAIFAQVTAQSAEVDILKARVTEVEGRLARNSQNSSKAPFCGSCFAVQIRSGRTCRQFRTTIRLKLSKKRFRFPTRLATNTSVRQAPRDAGSHEKGKGTAMGPLAVPE